MESDKQPQSRCDFVLYLLNISRYEQRTVLHFYTLSFFARKFWKFKVLEEQENKSIKENNSPDI